MSIKFICSCGKHLRARDEMAGKRSVCPQCGSPVGIPFLQPTHRGALGHMTPMERLRHQRRVPRVEELFQQSSPVQSSSQAPTPQAENVRARQPHPLSAELFPQPLDPALVRLAAGRSRRDRQLEIRWYQCLFYPLRAWCLIVILAGALTGLTAGTMFFLPELFKLQGSLLAFSLVAWVYILLTGVILGYACSVPEGALLSGMAGEFRFIRWPGFNPRYALRTIATWCICFLAGPILLVAASLVYWIYCGDPAFLDWLILAELNILAAIYGLFSLFAVYRRGNLADIAPWRVAMLGHRLDDKFFVVLCLAAILMLIHGLAALVALNLILHDNRAGWYILFLCWVSGLFWETFLFRLLGVWCHRLRVFRA